MNLENVKLDFDFDINQIIKDASELNIEILESEEPKIKYKNGYSMSTFDLHEFFEFEFNNKQQHYETIIKLGDLKPSISGYDKSAIKNKLINKNNSRMKIRDFGTNSIRNVRKTQSKKYLVGVH